MATVKKMKLTKDHPLKTSKVWRNEFYVTIYEFAKQGIGIERMGPAIGISDRLFKAWIKKDPAIRDAYERGKPIKGESANDQFLKYVHKRLPTKKLRRTWSLITEWWKIKDEDSIEELVLKQGKYERQHLFIHALLHCNFNASQACRMTGTDLGTYNNWKNDPQFRRIMEHIHQSKKDYFESALIKSVRNGDASTIRFVNKTFNKDRGYDNSVSVIRHEGAVTHMHGHMNIDAVLEKLPVEDRVKVLTAMRQVMSESNKPQLMLEKHNEEVSTDEVA